MCSRGPLLSGFIRFDKVRDVTSARWDFGTSGLARQLVFFFFVLPGLRVCIVVLAFLGGYMSCPFWGIRRNIISHLA